jgi:hypothetical protein
MNRFQTLLSISSCAPTASRAELGGHLGMAEWVDQAPSMGSDGTAIYYAEWAGEADSSGASEEDLDDGVW